MRNKLKLLVLLLLSFRVFSQDLAHTAPTSDVYNGERGISFNKDWKFYRGDATGANAASFNDASWKSLDLPHDFGIEKAFNPSSAATSEGGFLDGGIGWYRKTFTLPSAYSGKRISITFDGSFMNTEVWVNGNYLGIRPFGFITFSYDMTQYLNFGSKANVIAVKVNNAQKSCRWYSGSGIYRNVWLTPTDPVNIAFCGSKVTTPSVSATSASVSINTDVQNQSASTQTVSLLSVLTDKSGQVVASASSAGQSVTAGTTANIATSLSVSNPDLWSMESPNLYKLKTFVICNTNKVDSFASNVGFRNAEFNVNTGFSLNGKRVKIHGVCLHQDLGSLGSAYNYRALERQIEIMKNMGVNGIRTSHNPPTPELLEICDRMGMVVMNEVFDMWDRQKDDVKYGYNLVFDSWMPKDVKNWIMRDRNHPCVIMWSTGNEIPQMDASGNTSLAKIITEIKKYDTTRPITLGLNNWSYAPINSQLDIVGFNYASGSAYDAYRAANPTHLIIGSETSSAVRTRSVYHGPTTQNILKSSDMQCSSYDNSIVGWGHSAENSWKFDRDRAYVAGQFIWTGFDYIGEPTPYNHTFPAKSSYFGIVDMCGFPKDIYHFYKSQWTSAPMVHILPHWNWEKGTTIPVWTYSNCDSVRLIVNGTSLGAKTIIPSGNLHQEWKVPFVAGKVKALGFKKGVVVAMDSVVTSGDPTRIQTLTDRDSIHANGLDLAFIETNILDEAGNFCVNSDTLVNYSISGPGKIVGVDNGNPISVESFKGTSRKSFKGKCLAIVQSTGEPGLITVTASAPNYPTNVAFNKPATADSENSGQLINVASGKPVTSDSEQSSNKASYLTDGDTNTRWCANDGNAGHYVVVDLGDTLNLIGGKIIWENGNTTYKYKIETSTDNTNWTVTVDKTASNPSLLQAQQVEFSAAARYVKLTVTGVQNNNWASIYELNLYDGSKAMANIAPDATGITTDSQESANPATNVMDENTNTRWCANDGNAGHWLKYDFGSVRNLAGSEILWEKSGVAYKYKIEVSNDNVKWTMACDQTASTRTSQLRADNFNVSGRYVRITVTGGLSSNTWASIYEFRVFDNSTTASSNTDKAGYACDGDYSTAWSAADGNANHSLTVDLGSATSLTGSELTWMNAGVAYKYKVEASTDSLTWTTVADKTANTSAAQKQSDTFQASARYLKITITGGTSVLNPANVLEFKAFDGTTSTLKSSSVTIKAVSSDVSLGTESVIDRSGFMMYPNPANSILNIRANNPLNTVSKVEIFNVLGKKVYSGEMNANNNLCQVNISNLNNGIYLVRFGNNFSERLVISK